MATGHSELVWDATDPNRPLPGGRATTWPWSGRPRPRVLHDRPASASRGSRSAPSPAPPAPTGGATGRPTSPPSRSWPAAPPWPSSGSPSTRRRKRRPGEAAARAGQLRRLVTDRPRPPAPAQLPRHGRGGGPPGRPGAASRPGADGGWTATPVRSCVIGGRRARAVARRAAASCWSGPNGRDRRGDDASRPGHRRRRGPGRPAQRPLRHRPSAPWPSTARRVGGLHRGRRVPPGGAGPAGLGGPRQCRALRVGQGRPGRTCWPWWRRRRWPSWRWRSTAGCGWPTPPPSSSWGRAHPGRAGRCGGP